MKVFMHNNHAVSLGYGLCFGVGFSPFLNSLFARGEAASYIVDQMGKTASNCTILFVY